ncbi:TRAP transporter fused permease subunit, partial [Candidatus Sumerlaeota bacterium]|nr:TRAP transporter fused permease subunit [Candidatus Sumerlaeota bacterium]
MDSTVQRLRRFLIPALGTVLSLFVVFEVNYAQLTPLSQLAIFAMLGMVLCFLNFPVSPRLKDNAALRVFDFLLCAGAVVCCSYLIVEGKALGQRAGIYTTTDIVAGTVGIILVLEATRRSIGVALPILALLFIAYAMLGRYLPDWLFPHRGYGVDRIVAQTFLRTEGVFGTALRVMFTYVYLFVVFGAFLEASGATQFIIDFAERFFGKSPGGPAKVAVLGSGLMGSLSGSAVANAVTIGTFTIPMMRNSGFKPHIAAGITAAAASGGALVPPVMGAGAYMMLEIVDPPVTFVQIARAAIIPATLYYLSIFLIVHFFARRVGAGRIVRTGEAPRSLLRIEGFIFFAALASLIGFLLNGRSPFRAVTFSLAIILILSLTSSRTRITPRRAMDALVRASRNGIALVSASACVGIIIGIVTLTGVGTSFPNAIIPLAERSLFAALVAIMICSIVLGMGLPSAVCYLLMATLIGPVLNKLGVIPLAAHLFIFYFGMMSMVTPPVALAAFASASIAKANIMATGLAAFRFSL